MVVVEAVAHGVPVVVIDAPDNAAVDLITHGENGFVSPSTNPMDLAAAIVRAVRGGYELRESTLSRARHQGEALTIRGAMRQVLAVYSEKLRSNANRASAARRSHLI
jgi:glycosyltransferase involved in cell wall biosynthesis